MTIVISSGVSLRAQADCLKNYDCDISFYSEGRHWEEVGRGLPQCYRELGILCLPFMMIWTPIEGAMSYIDAKKMYTKAVKARELIEEAKLSQGRLLEDVLADFRIAKPNATRQQIIDLIISGSNKNDFCEARAYEGNYSFDEILKYIYQKLP